MRTPALRRVWKRGKKKAQAVGQLAIEAVSEEAEKGHLTLGEVAGRQFDEPSAGEAARRFSSRAPSGPGAKLTQELLTPTSRIRKAVGLTLRTPLSLEQRGYLETIRDSTDSLLQVIGVLLDSGESESGSDTRSHQDTARPDTPGIPELFDHSSGRPGEFDRKHGLNEDRERSTSAGMDDHVSKPTHAEELEAVLRRIFTTAERRHRVAGGSSERGVDRNLILQRVEGDVDLLRKLASLFLTQSEHLMKDIRMALAANDAGGVNLAANTLKGAISYFATGAAFESALRLETIGRSGHLRQAGDEFARLEAELATLHPQIAGLIGEDPRCTY